MSIIFMIIFLISFLFAIIGILNPKIVSNITKKLPNPIGTYLGNIESRIKSFGIYMLISFISVIMFGLFDGGEALYENGKEAFEKGDWATAVDKLSSVSSKADYFNESQEMLNTSKINLSEIYTNQKKWSEIIDLLSDFDEKSTLYQESSNILKMAQNELMIKEGNRNIEDAKFAIQNANWDKAIRLLKGISKKHPKIKISQDLIKQAQTKMFESNASEYLTEAEIAFDEKDWIAVIETLDGFPETHSGYPKAISLINKAKSISKSESIQKGFENKRYDFYSRYREAPNEIKKSAIWTECVVWTGKYAKDINWKIENWEAEIYSIDTDKGGETLTLSLRSKANGVPIRYSTKSGAGLIFENKYKTTIDKGSDIYNKVAELTEGQEVYFSAIFMTKDNAKSKLKNVSNDSWLGGESTGLRSPNFDVIFTDIYPIK